LHNPIFYAFYVFRKLQELIFRIYIITLPIYMHFFVKGICVIIGTQNDFKASIVHYSHIVKIFFKNLCAESFFVFTGEHPDHSFTTSCLYSASDSELPVVTACLCVVGLDEFKGGSSHGDSRARSGGHGRVTVICHDVLFVCYHEFFMNDQSSH